MPTQARLGLGVQASLLHAQDISINMEGLWPLEDQPLARLGLGFSPFGALQLRVGSSFNHDLFGLVAGFGLQFELMGVVWDLDYAYLPIDGLGSQQRYELGMKF